MELKHDCVRNVMLYLEENLTLRGVITNNNIEIKNYSSDDITYTIMKLREAGFIEASKQDYAGIILIKSITYNGHQFLDTIRDGQVWSETKSKISKIAGVSLPIIQQVASQIIMLKLGITP